MNFVLKTNKLGNRNKMRISFNFYIIPAAIFVFFTGRFDLYAIAYFSAFLHEIAHILIARRFNLTVEEIKFLPIGFAAKVAGLWKLSSKRELILLIAGPAVNLLLSVFLLFVTNLFPSTNKEIIKDTILINIFLALFNMLPMLPLDGGRILMVILSREVGIIKCASFCMVISKILNIIFFILSMVLLAFSGNFMMIIVICYTLGLIFYEDKHIIADSILYILNKSSLIKKNQVILVKPLVVTESTCLIILLKEIDRTKMINALVLNDDNKIIGSVDELRIIEYILESGINASIKELL